jgi:hypothetical protein
MYCYDLNFAVNRKCEKVRECSRTGSRTPTSGAIWRGFTTVHVGVCLCFEGGNLEVFCATGVGVPVEEVYIGWWGRLKSLPALSSRRIQDFPTRVHRILYALADLDSATPVGPPLHPPGILQGEKHFRAWRKISSLYSNLILYWFTFSGLGKLK